MLGSGDDGDVVRRGRRDPGQLVMGSSVIVRLGGLVAIVGGLAATILGLLYVLRAWGMTLDFTAKALQKGHYENPVATMLLIGVLAAIVALHLVQRWYYGRWGPSPPLRPSQVLRWSFPVTLWASWRLLRRLWT